MDALEQVGTLTLPSGKVVQISEPADCPGLKIVAWEHMPEWAADAFRQWHFGAQHPLGPYLHDFRAWAERSVPTSGLADYITNLAREHGVRYDKTPGDVLAEAITRLADDDVQMDQVELLLLALERAGVIASENVVPLHINYLREKLSMEQRKTMSGELDDMLAGMTPENQHAEVDFGEAVGMENIADYLPHRLDDIVRKHRDEVQIRLATEEEIEALAGEILPCETKDTLIDWYPVAFVVKGQLVIRLLGHFERKSVVSIASRVLMLDLTAGLALTDNSTYALGRRGEGEPLGPYVVHLCALLSEMGAGRALGLPEIFF